MQWLLFTFNAVLSIGKQQHGLKNETQQFSVHFVLAFQ